MLKGIYWVASAKEDLKVFPSSVCEDMGYALYLAQRGEKSLRAKPLKGFSGTGVLEIVDNFNTDTYRAVYTVRFGDCIYVLHAFQKKSKTGIATPQKEIDLIKVRLKAAESHYENQFKISKERKI
jgi:phage-related protein